MKKDSIDKENYNEASDNEKEIIVPAVEQSSEPVASHSSTVGNSVEQNTFSKSELIHFMDLYGGYCIGKCSVSQIKKMKMPDEFLNELLSKEQGVQVSDTTKSNSSNADDNINSSSPTVSGEEVAVERILCAAIHVDDGKEHLHQPKNIKTGFVICGRRHHNCYRILEKIPEVSKLNVGREGQGFLTTLDRYVDRKEAFQIAKAAGQCLQPEIINEAIGLTSEDLY